MSLELGVRLYKEQKFRECYATLAEFCRDPNEKNHEKLQALEYLQKLSPLLNSYKEVVKISIEILASGDLFLKEKVIFLMNYKARSLWPLSLKAYEILIIVKALEEIGAKSSSHQLFNEICELNIGSFKINMLRELIESALKTQFNYSFSLDHLLMVEASFGNREKVSKILSDSLEDFLNLENRYYKAFMGVRSLIAKNIKFWRGSILYDYEIMMRIEGIPITGSGFDRKKIINMILDTIMMAPTRVLSYVLLSEYALKFQRKELCQKVTLILRLFCKNNDKILLNYVKNLESKTHSINETVNQENTTFDEFDFGEDLFQTESVDSNLNEKNVFEISNNKTLDTQLDKYTADNFLDIDNQTKNETQEADILLVAQLNKTIEMFDDNFIKKNIHDIAACLNFIKMYKVLIRQLKKIIEQDEDDDRNEDLMGLLAQAYFDDESYHKCLDVCYDVLCEYPLNEDGYCFFMYLIAESYWAIDLKSKALTVYKEISSIKRNYRLVPERLRTNL